MTTQAPAERSRQTPKPPTSWDCASRKASTSKASPSSRSTPASASPALHPNITCVTSLNARLRLHQLCADGIKNSENDDNEVQHGTTQNVRWRVQAASRRAGPAGRQHHPKCLPLQIFRSGNSTQNDRTQRQTRFPSSPPLAPRFWRTPKLKWELLRDRPRMLASSGAAERAVAGRHLRAGRFGVFGLVLRLVVRPPERTQQAPERGEIFFFGSR
ncbi:hypothetical protein Deipe_0679 [Deinococcus peraridilitoris DSM 19664]|uniref:Uncharacterized protein n=1 Tax=Deinococcus peraridilitoris (strain DSM 19664 / LMG 22246 / CIP 109416 / KR-200) TaxID=937777 RepID=K9ZYI6_DEIPD|nr:hypothetical protein Deipe_0679 [Deinococcus peraridilitoris DSM 19664]